MFFRRGSTQAGYPTGSDAVARTNTGQSSQAVAERQAEEERKVALQSLNDAHAMLRSSLFVSRFADVVMSRVAKARERKEYLKLVQKAVEVDSTWKEKETAEQNNKIEQEKAAAAALEIKKKAALAATQEQEKLEKQRGEVQVNITLEREAALEKQVQQMAQEADQVKAYSAEVDAKRMERIRMEAVEAENRRKAEIYAEKTRQENERKMKEAAEAKRLAEEAERERKAAEEEAERFRLEEEARKAEEEAKRKAEEEAKRLAEEERQKNEEKRRLAAEAEAAERQQNEEQRRLAAEAEAAERQRLQEEEAARKKAEEEAQRAEEVRKKQRAAEEKERQIRMEAIQARIREAEQRRKDAEAKVSDDGDQALRFKQARLSHVEREANSIRAQLEQKAKDADELDRQHADRPEDVEKTESAKEARFYADEAQKKLAAIETKVEAARKDVENFIANAKA